MNGDIVFFDCEPQKNFDEIQNKSHVWDLMLSISTTFSKNENRYRIWSFSQKDLLIEYLNNKTVVGYNISTFDLPILLGENTVIDDQYNVTNNKRNFKCTCIDVYYRIMEEIYRCHEYNKLLECMKKHPLTSRKAYSMFNVYCNTLGVTLSKDVFDVRSIELFRSKQILQLVEYNMYKLRMCRCIYEFINKHHFIVNGDYDIVQVKNY